MKESPKYLFSSKEDTNQRFIAHPAIQATCMAAVMLFYNVAQAGEHECSGKKYEKNKAKYAPIVEEVAKQYRHISAEYMERVIDAESCFDPNAKSPVGAEGLMQLMPDTAKRFGVNNRTNGRNSIEGGAKYLNWLVERFEKKLLEKYPFYRVKGRSSRLKKDATVMATYSYNAGEGNGDKRLEELFKQNTLPSYLAMRYLLRKGGEPHNYLIRVLGKN